MSAYTTGTATFTAGSTAVTGTGTAWTADMIGARIERNGLSGIIAAVTSGTSITLLQGAPAGMAGTGTYAIDRNTADAATGAAVLPKVDAMLDRWTAAQGAPLDALNASSTYSRDLWTNVDQTAWRADLGVAASSHTHDASATVSGVFADALFPARLGTLGQNITDWNAATTSGNYRSPRSSDGALNTPSDGHAGFTGHYWQGITEHSGIVGFLRQEVTSLNGWANGQPEARFERWQFAGTWTPWRRLWITQDGLDARYVQPSRLLRSATPSSPTVGTNYAGSTLTPAQTGTWQNRGGDLYVRVV